MGVPTSEVGYTPAMPRREDHEVHKDMWRHWGGELKNKYSTTFKESTYLYHAEISGKYNLKKKTEYEL